MTQKTLPMLAAMIGLATSYSYADSPLNIGFIVPNPVGEVGWDHELDRGRQMMEAHFGDQISVTAVDSVGEGPDATRMMNRMAAQGADMIFLGSFGHMNDGILLAKRNENLAVIHAGGYLTGERFATYAPRHYQASYLCGMAAGYVAEDAELGIIAAFPLPEVIGMMNAYVLGAQSVNPAINNVQVVWLNSWFDPARNRSAAEALISGGVDVLYSLFPGTPAAISAAEENGVYAVATLSDNSQFAPTKHLCAGQTHFGAIYINYVNSVMNGNFAAGDTFAGIAEDAMEVAGLSPDLTDNQRNAILAKQDEIRAGTFEPFTGPITDNSGDEVVTRGVRLTIGDIKGMNFLVQGLDTTLPN
ncbi:MAG: BMP family ABC transporter substrate-binding protein [Aestuariivita sp.]|nr:BMP family ABC transporter substrate-binding protein [Aestuariivita sp.]